MFLPKLCVSGGGELSRKYVRVMVMLFWSFRDVKGFSSRNKYGRTFSPEYVNVTHEFFLRLTAACKSIWWHIRDVIADNPARGNVPRMPPLIRWKLIRKSGVWCTVYRACCSQITPSLTNFNYGLVNSERADGKLDAAPKLSGTVLGFRAERFEALKFELYNYGATTRV